MAIGKSGYLAGVMLLVASVSLFGAVDGISKMLVATQSFGQIVLARYVLTLPILLAAVGPGRWHSLFHTEQLELQLLRGVAPLIIGGSMVIGVTYLPLAEATVILFAGPFIVVALSGKLLGEHVRLASWIGVAVGFLAVLIVARPGFSELSKFTIFPIVAAVFYALFQLLTRKLAAAGEDALTTLAWTILVGVVITAPLAVIMWRPMSAEAWTLSIALGVVFGLAQLLMAKAFDYAPANVLTPFSYAQIIAATLFGIFAFHDLPDFWTVVGIVMIIAAGAFVMKNSTRQQGGAGAPAAAD